MPCRRPRPDPYSHWFRLKKPLKFFIKIGGQTFTAEIGGSTAPVFVGSFFHMLACTYGLLPGSWYATVGTKPMMEVTVSGEKMCLHDYNIADGSTVNIMMRLRGGTGQKDGKAPPAKRARRDAPAQARASAAEDEPAVDGGFVVTFTFYKRECGGRPPARPFRPSLPPYTVFPASRPRQRRRVRGDGDLLDRQ